MGDLIDFDTKKKEEKQKKVKLRLKGNTKLPPNSNSEQWLHDIEFHTSKIMELVKLLRKKDAIVSSRVARSRELVRFIRKKLDEDERKKAEKDEPNKV